MPHDNVKRKSPAAVGAAGPVGVHAFGVLDGCHSERIDDATGSAKLQASAALKSSKVWQRGLAALAGHPHQQIGGAL